jgi:hypothetical protein
MSAFPSICSPDARSPCDVRSATAGRGTRNSAGRSGGRGNPGPGRGQPWIFSGGSCYRKTTYARRSHGTPCSRM